MVNISTDTLGACWLECIRSVLDKGIMHHDENVTIRELLGVSVNIESPSSHDPLIESAGDPKVIERMLNKFSKGVVMEDRPFTYGQLIYDMNGVDQFEWMVQRLRNKPETKSATVSLLTPGLNALNLPCLNVLDAKLRYGEIHLQFFFRSQNIFGRQYANLIALANLLEKLAQSTGHSVGTLKGYIASAHIYEYDLETANEIINDSGIRLTDKYYTMGPASVRG